MLSPEFYHKLNQISGELGMNPRDLLLVMFFESGGINPAAHNPGGATGLIQFMPDTLKGMGLGPKQIANFGNVSAENQLDYVKKYIEGKSNIMHGQPFTSATQYYHANFFPRTLTRWHGNDPYSNKGVVVVSKFSKHPDERAAYKSNMILDTNHDGYITVGDLIRTLSKTSQNPRFQQALSNLNSVAGSGQVSEFSNKNTKPSNTLPTTNQQQPIQEPKSNSFIDEFLAKVNNFVSKLIGASEKHLIVIQSSADLSSKLEYARILKMALEEELGVKSDIFTDGNTVHMETQCISDKIASEQVIMEVSDAISNAFKDATKNIGSLVVKASINTETQSKLSMLDVDSAIRNYRMFNLKFCKGRNEKNHR